MAHETTFNDALDYIYIANNIDANSYFIINDKDGSSEVVDNYNSAANSNKNNIITDNRMSPRTANIIATMETTSATVAPTVAAGTGTSSAIITDIPSASLSAAVAAAATAMLSSAGSNAAATVTTNAATAAAAVAIATAATDAAGINFAGVAVGLGAMLINDTILMEANGTSGYFGEVINGTYYITSTTTNSTFENVTSSDDEDFANLLKMAATSVILGLMILITIIGNVFVIAAIILERNLQNVANYLVASLAVADLLVACLVMPLGAVYEISEGWILGPELCDIWTSCDVLCCTASILHLVAIAMDRYWAVTNIDYIHSRTSRRVFLMIFCVWTAAVIVSLAPQFGWKDPDYLQRIEQQKCMVSQDIAYQIFATCCTFYVPLTVILALYWKIYQTARKRIHRRRPRPIDITANNNQSNGQKKRRRLRLRLGRFAAAKANNTTGDGGTGTNGNGVGADGVVTTGGSSGGGSGGGGGGSFAGGHNTTALCIVEGNSSNTVNTVEDIEFSSSNIESRAGIEVATTSSSQISTVSHLVALANQQHATSIKQTKQIHGKQQKQQQQQQQQQEPTVLETTAAVLSGNADATQTTTTTLTTTAATMESTATEATANIGSNVSANAPPTQFTIVESSGPANGGTVIEVLADPQLQQQLEQVQRQQQTAKMASTGTTTTAITKGNTVGGSGGGGGGGGGGASTSNATTITSISALSPQTPPSANVTSTAATTMTATTSLTIGVATTNTTAGNMLTSSSSIQTIAHPLCGSSSANASGQVTPVPRTKNQQQQHISSIANPMQKVNKRKETLEAKRERKAAKTLAIITGAFVVCWLPFFVMAITLPLCTSCEISDGVSSLFLWLGYFNSTLNPVIYTIFSPEFRQAFKRILYGGHRSAQYRSGKL